MDVAPKGYVVGVRQPYNLANSQPIQLTFVLDPGGQSVSVALVDQDGKALTGGCAWLFTTNAIGQRSGLVSTGCASEKSNGIAALGSVVPGDYAALPVQSPSDYAPITSSQAIHVVDGEDATATFTYQPAGAATFTVLMPDGSPSQNYSCLALTSTAKDNPSVSSACGPDQSGAFSAASVPVGTYLVTQGLNGSPKGLAFPAKSIKVKIKQGKSSHKTITLEPGGQGIVVTTLDDTGQSVSGSCVNIFKEVDGAKGQQAGSGCSSADESQSGTTTVWGLPPGAYLVQATSFGQLQLALPAPTKVDVETGKAAEVTIQALPTTTLKVSVTGAKHKLTKTCFAAVTTDVNGPALYNNFRCDEDDGVIDGRVEFVTVPADSTITVLALAVPSGWTLPDAVTVSAVAGKAKSVKLVANRRFGADNSPRRCRGSAAPIHVLQHLCQPKR